MGVPLITLLVHYVIMSTSWRVLYVIIVTFRLYIALGVGLPVLAILVLYVTMATCQQGSKRGKLQKQVLKTIQHTYLGRNLAIGAISVLIVFASMCNMVSAMWLILSNVYLLPFSLAIN